MTDKQNNGWAEYIAKTKNNPPRPWLVKALPFVEKKEQALDLGAGALIDTKYLLDQGFMHVIAVDQSNIAQDIYDALPHNKLEYVISTFEDYEFPPATYDIINAQFALPFHSPATFNEMFAKIINSLKHSGVFVGQFFGERDEWNVPEKNMSFHTKEEVERLLPDMEIIEMEEEEKDQMPIVGDLKHWHIFHVIARKK